MRVRAATASRRRRLDQERRLPGGAHRGYVAVYMGNTVKDVPPGHAALCDGEGHFTRQPWKLRRQV